MHKTAMLHARLFFEAYVPAGSFPTIVDIGAQDVNGSLRGLAPAGSTYIGVDFCEGRGVDVVIADSYELPFERDSADVVVSTSCFEHSEFFWLSILEALRILKPHGLLFLNVPSNGPFHRYPVDCWRFYPDSGVALQNWARHNGLDTLMLESFTGVQRTGMWNDFVAVFVKDGQFAARYPSRIQTNLADYTNGLVAGSATFSKPAELPQDQRAVGFLRPVIRAALARLGRAPD